MPEGLNKNRVDQTLVELKLVQSRQRAVALVISGKVFLNEIKVLKPSKIVSANSIIKIKKKDHEWVSRGGVKLNWAIKKFKVNVKKKICVDIGCSSGGFSEVLLTNGAETIYSVDVGYGQFDWKLRNSEKIILLEKTNARFLDQKLIPQRLDLVVCDVSFISLRKVLEPIKLLLKKSFELIILIKPQFEIEKKMVGKGGIVKDPLVHKKVCDESKEWISNQFHTSFLKIIDSPIYGQKGNKEFLLYAKKN